MDVHAIQVMFDYNYTAHDRVWDCVMELPPQEFIAEGLRELTIEFCLIASNLRIIPIKMPVVKCGMMCATM